MLRAWAYFALLFAVVFGAHLCHTGVLWEPETFPLAAAAQMRHGHVLYREIWYDKPPLSPLLHLAVAYSALALRALGALYTLACSWLAFGFARELWGRREAFWAAGLLAFFLTFDFPASILPLGPDLLMVGPHLAAVWLAWRKRPFLAGVVAGVALLSNAKGVFVLLACASFAWPAVPMLVAGFAAPCLVGAAVLWGTGASQGFIDQVWIWSSLYAASPFLANPLGNGVVRTASWLGFHSSLLAGAIWRLPWRFALWIAISAVAVSVGLRFFPRYYLQLLPPLCLAASFGAARFRCRNWVVAALLLIPLIRFAPRYVTVAKGTPWRDTALDQDSRHAAALLAPLTHPGDTLFIWGYRPELWVYSQLPDGTRFLDSQPLTGVPADRHLEQAEPIDSAHPAAARAELAQSRPTFVADGLSLYNPKLAITNYPELRAWFAGYREIGRTAGTVVYRRTGSNKEVAQSNSDSKR